MAKKPKAYGKLSKGELSLVMVKRIKDGDERNKFIFQCIRDAYKPTTVHRQFEKAMIHALPCGSRGGMSLYLPAKTYEWMERFVNKHFKELILPDETKYLKIKYPNCGSGCTLAIRFGKESGSLFDH